MATAKLVFFSDLHRGMGTKDVFIKNKELFVKVLDYYNRQGYTLVLVGDVEEGWGFQRDNIPLILQDHNDELDKEMEFLKDNRYYRVYGNHDDYYRGLYFRFKNFETRVNPAVIFEDKENNFTIFVTHGCQGHGLHDAGDELASWGVYVKYNWLTEIFDKRPKSEKELDQAITQKQQEYQKHEQMVVDWVKDDGTGKKRYNILIAGHTHIPVFESIPVEETYQALIRQIDSGEYLFFNDVIDGQEENRSQTLPSSLKEKMKKTLTKELLTARSMRLTARQRALEGKSTPQQEEFYYNPGYGFGPTIPCIEICDGKITLKFIESVDENGVPIAEILAKTGPGIPAEEHKYKRSLADFKDK
jgi:UDP-2,3-diacylglucosamine pyrophosphatase LpxH